MSEFRGEPGKHDAASGIRATLMMLGAVGYLLGDGQ